MNIKVTGINELHRDYSAFRADFSDFKEPLTEATSFYLKEVDKNFFDHGKTFNKEWAPLSEFTIKRKKELMKKGKAISLDPLIMTGKMMMGFGAFVKSAYGQLFNSQAYAQVHQDGGFATMFGKKVKVPQRILADVDDAREAQVASIFGKWLDRTIMKHSL